ncbi:MAG TPA: HAD-IIIA family hydrolase [Chitinophagaceae bacterium]|nr:HAD-IIIA family hydrolase [Chitinophagaceae bacterium]
MINEAIILAGGLGTRLRESVPDLPKCMAPVAGRPFLFYVINYLRSQGITRFIFSVGYKHEIIESWLAEQFPTLDYVSVIEEEPLGTGGAIRHAGKAAQGKTVLITNGDTLYKIDLPHLETLHAKNNADCTIALKPMEDFDRYGVVALDENNRVVSFKEKQFYQSGLINGGTYLLNMPGFLHSMHAEKFSFEQDYLEKNEHAIYGCPQDAYFIDIGVPDDFLRAQKELLQPALHVSNVDPTWTLFIDRDGVINQEKKDGYILSKEDFRFMDGVKESFATLAARFGNIIVVSNQRGIGKGLMTETELTGIHEGMQKAIEEAGGRIDKIYYCTVNNDKDPNRKPNPGMAFLAKKDLSSIDLSKSLMVGNKLTDMQFGRNAGMYTVYLKTTHPEQALPHPDIDLAFDSLADFAKAL